MLSDILLIVVFCCGTIGAQGPEDPKSEKIYDVIKWRSDISNVFGQFWRKEVDIRRSIDKLNEIVAFEKLPEFYRYVSEEKEYFSSRIENYFKDSLKVTVETSLLHKSKMLSEKMIDLLMIHIGCSYDEFSKIETVKRIFKPLSRIDKTIDKKLRAELEICGIGAKILVQSTSRLLSKDEIDTVQRLHSRIQKKALDEYVNYQYDADPAAIEFLSHSIAMYLKRLDHPELESIPANNLDQFEILLEEIYKVEVYEPCAKMCNLLKPIRQGVLSLRKTMLGQQTNFQKLPDKLEMTIDFACDLASFAYASIRNRIWYYFSKFNTLL